MSENRRLKIKFGDAEFEADVPENDVQPMYDRFLSILERRRSSLVRQNGTSDRQSEKSSETIEEGDQGRSADVHREISDHDHLLTRVFDLRRDGVVILKVLPNGPSQHADALLLLLYGYHQVKKEERVLATELNRSAQQSGVPLRRLAHGYASNRRYVVRTGQRKGSNYSLNSEGWVIAKKIMVTLFDQTEAAAPRVSSETGPYRETVPEGSSRVELGLRSRWPGVAGGRVLP